MHAINAISGGRGPFIVVTNYTHMAKLMIDGIEYDLLSRGDNNKVVALDGKRVGKLFELGNLQGTDELNLLKKANSINQLLVGVIALQPTDNYEWDLLIMERLYSLEHRALSSKERLKLAEKFVIELKELHTGGLAHWDIKRPERHKYGGSWDNIIVTRQAVRLIDCGISVTADHPEFEEACEDDLRHAEEWIKNFIA